ncbi:MAG: hypothetical protein IIU15_04360 [Treponema sp.]|nr:hypothetical protein [Treponema sp.]
MKNRFKAGVLAAAVFSLIFASGCSKDQGGKKASPKSAKKDENTVTVPHGVVFSGALWNISGSDAVSYFSDVIPGTMVEVSTSNGKAESKKLQSGDETKEFIRVKIDDMYLWVDSDGIVLDVLPYYVLETGTDVFFYEKPDADAKHEKRLPPDTIVAFVGQCENTREYPEGQKFGRIKLPAANPGEYEDGYVRLSNIDNSAAHLAMIQVSQKYAQYSGRGDVPVEILNELEDNIGELRSWSGR